MKLSVILFLILLVNTYSQTTSLTGNIINQESKLSIPFVNIGVQGTYFGTSTNEFGDFKLVLENGKHTLIFSCVGFKTQIIPITSPLNKKLRIELKPIPVELPEVIIDAG